MRTAHVRCGDDLRETLGAAGFAGDFVPFTDPVCQGPVPRTADPAEFDAVRADWLAQAYDLDRGSVLERLSRERAGIDALDAYDRVVLWFEHDWFDQAILGRLLALLAHRPTLHQRLRLLSVDAFPGEDPFIGFGQLSASQLATLGGWERPVIPDQFAVAQQAWTALSAPDLSAYGQRILHGDATWQTFPRWVGGVLLPGWRWDPGASRPVPA